MAQDATPDVPSAASEKPFNDTPFNAGVDADENSDPKKFIQQLSGKIGQSLRKYEKEIGQPDLELEKFAINSVLAASHTADMDEEDRQDIISKVKSSGAEADVANDTQSDAVSDTQSDTEVTEPAPSAENDVEQEPDVEEGLIVDDINEFSEDSQFDALELKNRSDFEATDVSNCCSAKFIFGDICSRCGEHATPEKSLQSNENFGIFGETTKKMIKNKLSETFGSDVEPAVKPRVEPKTKPEVKPQPLRKDKPFKPTRVAQPKPKASIEEGGGDTSTNIVDSKQINDDTIIISMVIDGEKVPATLYNTGELIEKPLAYDEPWVYLFKSNPNIISGKVFSVGVNFFGHPNTDLTYGGLADDTVEIE